MKWLISHRLQTGARDVTRPQPHEAETTTHEAEATTHEGEAEATTHEAEAKTYLEILIIITVSN